MAKSGTERQAAFRERNAGDGKRLSMMVTGEAKQVLEQLAKRWDVSQRAAFERLMDEAKKKELVSPGAIAVPIQLPPMAASESGVGEQKKDAATVSSPRKDSLRSFADILAQHWKADCARQS
ncbi:hypothetical protein [Chromobacterium subtsugae]|uniref:hypothetical protein n=1 Tax=Chromobacterium subtsugae TaxID=251747 RepID=UPI00128C7573|nr:hypothetical protein [Chromobacterium subtsugae]